MRHLHPEASQKVESAGIQESLIWRYGSHLRPSFVLPTSNLGHHSRPRCSDRRRLELPAWTQLKLCSTTPSLALILTTLAILNLSPRHLRLKHQPMRVVSS